MHEYNSQNDLYEDLCNIYGIKADLDFCSKLEANIQNTLMSNQTKAYKIKRSMLSQKIKTFRFMGIPVLQKIKYNNAREIKIFGLNFKYKK